MGIKEAPRFSKKARCRATVVVTVGLSLALAAFAPTERGGEPAASTAPSAPAPTRTEAPVMPGPTVPPEPKNELVAVFDASLGDPSVCAGDGNTMVISQSFTAVPRGPRDIVVCDSHGDGLMNNEVEIHDVLGNMSNCESDKVNPLRFFPENFVNAYTGQRLVFIIDYPVTDSNCLGSKIKPEGPKPLDVPPSGPWK